jgi:hypothetical protein
MVTYHCVKIYVSIINHLEVWNFNFTIGFYSKSHPLWTPQNMTYTFFTPKLKIYIQLETYIYNSIRFYLILSSSSWDLAVDTFMSQRKKGE